MVCYPEAQKKAQAEIDAVVGRDRLPSLADRPQLPYITAVMNEVFRWSPVAPLAIPHSAMQDDVYQGYLIPKGSLVIPNIWYVSTITRALSVLTDLGSWQITRTSTRAPAYSTPIASLTRLSTLLSPILITWSLALVAGLCFMVVHRLALNELLGFAPVSILLTRRRGWKLLWRLPYSRYRRLSMRTGTR